VTLGHDRGAAAGVGVGSEMAGQDVSFGGAVFRVGRPVPPGASSRRPPGQSRHAGRTFTQ
jgi:hypothetical protein